MDDQEFDNQLARSCVDAGIHPWLPEEDDLPPGCPVPAIQVHACFSSPPTEDCPMKTWKLTVMLEQQVGSMSYWIPATLCGPNRPLETSDEYDDDPDLGWTMTFVRQPHDYPDLEDMSQEWWPTLEHWWWDMPDRYKRYDPYWRKKSDCMHCACTGIVTHNLEVKLPCPLCRTTPVHVSYGWRRLMWLPAHTQQRRPHAKKGARWRWQGTGYVVDTILGYPEDMDDDFVWVGLRLVTAPHSVSRRWQVGGKWGDHDVDSEGALVLVEKEAPRDPTRWDSEETAGRPWDPLKRLHRRIASWFDSSVVQLPPAFNRKRRLRFAQEQVDEVATMLSQEPEGTVMCHACGAETPHVVAWTSIPAEYRCAPCLWRQLMTFRQMEQDLDRTG